MDWRIFSLDWFEGSFCSSQIIYKIPTQFLIKNKEMREIICIRIMHREAKEKLFWFCIRIMHREAKEKLFWFCTQ